MDFIIEIIFEIIIEGMVEGAASERVPLVLRICLRCSSWRFSAGSSCTALLGGDLQSKYSARSVGMGVFALFVAAAFKKTREITAPNE